MAIVSKDSPFDIRNFPVWVIPTIRRLLRVENLRIWYAARYYEGTPDSVVYLDIDILGEGSYMCILRKAEVSMNNPGMPRLI